MSKQIIIDWQKDSLLMVRGSGRGSKVALDAVAFQAIGEQADGHQVTVEEAVHLAAGKAGVSKGEVTVIASREVVEVRTLAVPRIDADELPDVIRFQAQRQLANMTDTWALDFVMLPTAPGQEMQTALVGCLSPNHLAEMERACGSAGLQVTNVVLRPIEITRFALERGAIPDTGVSMIICVTDQHVDLMTLWAGHVVQIRGTRLPAEQEALPTALRGEIKRSLMAASSLVGNNPLSHVLLIANPATTELLESTAAEATGAPVNCFDPTTLLATHIDERLKIASTSGHRLSAVAGAVGVSQADKRLLLDFKNPKKRPPKKKNTARLVMYGAAAALLLATGVAWWLMTNWELDATIAHLQTQVEDKSETVKWAQTKVADLNEVEKFLRSSPNWLDEMTYVATKIPPASEIMLESPLFTVARDGSAQIRVPVRANESSSISAFEETLRDEHHNVQGSELAQLDQPIDNYRWRAVETISITGRGWNLLSRRGTPATTAENATEGATAESASSPAAAASAPDEPAAQAAPTDDNAKQDTPEEPEPAAAEASPAAAEPDAAKAAAPPPEASESPAEPPPAALEPDVTKQAAIAPAKE